jgi:hypothetical protein
MIMALLFTGTRFHPKDGNGDPYPGALAYFYLTETTTDADVYEDADLATPHSQPVEADSDGLFPAIYLDPTVDYKLTLRESDSTLIYTTDPASPRISTIGDEVEALSGNQTVLTSQRDSLLNIAGTATISLPAAATAGEGFRVVIRHNGSSGIVTIDPSGAETINGLTTIGLGVNSSAICICNDTAWFALITGHEAGSFTGTQTGYAASLTPTIKWRKTGDRVTLYLETASTGTSNATTMTLTGMPSNLYPATVSVVLSISTDNGTQAAGHASVSTSGTVTFGLTAAALGGYTGSGTKGLAAGWQISYSIA